MMAVKGILPTMHIIRIRSRIGGTLSFTKEYMALLAIQKNLNQLLNMIIPIMSRLVIGSHWLMWTYYGNTNRVIK